MTSARWTSLKFVALGLITVFLVACGGGDDDISSEPTATIVVVLPPTASAPTVAPTATSRPPTPTPAAGVTPTPKPTATAKPVAAPTQVAPEQFTGTANVSGKTTAQIFQVSLSGCGWCDALVTRYGVFDSLLRVDYRELPEWGPLGSEGIATAWEVTSDFSKITFTIRSGVKFHNGWGEVTPEDVAFSFNDSLSEGSLYTRAAPMGVWMDRWEAIDSDTVILHLKSFSFNWATKLSNGGDTTTPIVSKKAFDELGSDEFNITDMGTGPFTVRSWDVDNEIIVDRFADYYREDGRALVASVRYITMPEASVQVAALRTGELDIATGSSSGLDPALIKTAVQSTGGEIVGLGIPGGAQINFGGNYWGTTYFDTGDQVGVRAGFKPDKDHPWIGDPSGEGNSMESARLVRKAMALAIDRQLLVDTVMDGLGSPAYTVIGSVPGDAVWKDAWDISYDPEQAKQLLAQAGYPDGFSFKYWQGIDTTAYMAEPIVQMWGAIGLDAIIDTTTYDATRPTMVDRSIEVPFMHGGGKGKGFDQAFGGNFVPTLGVGDGVEVPDDIAVLHWNNLSELDKVKRVENTVALQDWLSEWVITIPTTYDLGAMYIVNKGVSWSPNQADFSFFNSPETITLDR